MKHLQQFQPDTHVQISCREQRIGCNVEVNGEQHFGPYRILTLKSNSTKVADSEKAMKSELEMEQKKYEGN